MKHLKLILLILFFVQPASVRAQDPEKTQPEPKPKASEKKTERKHGTYIKGQLAHWQGNIFGKSLTEWKGNLFGSDYDLTSVGVEIETYFAKNHILLSGFSVGYRKDDLRYADYGHMFNVKTFRTFDLKVIEIKPSVGVEWGMPSASFDKTHFNYGTDGSLNYRHTYPVKNAPVPFVRVQRNGALYPFGELSLQKRAGPVLIETGMRVNVIMFGIDNYSVKNDHVEYDFVNKRMPSPYLFASIGLKLF